MMRHAVFAAILALAPVWCSAATPGVVTQRPAEGRCVEADGVFLVAHEVTIPGTDITFVMEPVPGDEMLAPYWIGRCEVTWGEYYRYMELCTIFERFDDAGIRQVTDENRVDAITAPSKLYDPSFTFDSGEAPTLPAVSMTQYAAKQYTKWLSLLTGQFYRLPSDAEWTHACRAGGDLTLPAEAIDAHAWHEDNADWATQDVGQKEPNAWGLYDMRGNASEWVLDAFEEGQPADPDGPGGEPPVRWPTKLYPRGLRGGSVFLPVDQAIAASARPSDDKAWREYDPNVPKSPWWFARDDAQDVGFRIVRPYHVPERTKQNRYWDADVARIQEVADFRIDEEGRGERGLVDPELPKAIARLKE